MSALSRKAVQVGERVPDITLPTVDGGTVGLRSFRGRRLIIFMWSSW